MITDLHLQKYLEGRLSAEETLYVEEQLEKNPEWRQRLEVLQNEPQAFARPIWQRTRMSRKDKSGSRMRFNSIMPVLLLIVILVAISGHWFARPGANSTFTLQDGNGSSLELIYNSARGWRYLDANYALKDSLSISVRDSGNYYVRLLGIYQNKKSIHIAPIWDGGELLYNLNGAKPKFSLESQTVSADFAKQVPQFFLLQYNDKPLPVFDETTLLPWLLAKTKGERLSISLPFSYQIFHTGH